MSETKDEIAAERDQLAAENEQLRSQLAAIGAAAPGQAATPQHTFQLSEGDRQELGIRGVVNIGGRLMTKEMVEAKLGDDQRDVDIPDAPEGTRVPAQMIAEADARARSGGIRGVDFVYPSVQPGGIDPKIAGTPGISGPPAEAV